MQREADDLRGVVDTLVLESAVNTIEDVRNKQVTRESISIRY